MTPLCAAAPEWAWAPSPGFKLKVSYAQPGRALALQPAGVLAITGVRGNSGGPRPYDPGCVSLSALPACQSVRRKFQVRTLTTLLNQYLCVCIRIMFGMVLKCSGNVHLEWES